MLQEGDRCAFGLRAVARRPIAASAGPPVWLDRVPFAQADETRMKQKPFSCENVVKQIAGINARHGAVTRKSRTQ